MTQPNETQERLGRMRANRDTAFAEAERFRYYEPPTWRDVDFLLSLIDTRAPVDSQGAGDDKYHEGFDDAARMSRICGKLSAEVKGLLNNEVDAHRYGAFLDVVRLLESLTLDQVKQKEQSK